MNRKWLTLLLALLLSAALPLSAMAATQHTLTVVPGEMLSSEQAITDLLNTVDLRLTTGTRSGALTVLMNDQDLVSLGLTADATGLYAQSEVLGEDVLYVTWEDGFAVLTDLMKTALQDDPAAAQAMEAAMVEAQQSIAATIGAEMADSTQPSPATVEEAMAMVGELFPNDPKMGEYVQSLLESTTVEDGSFAHESRDTADQKYRMVMDADDLIILCDTEYMQTTLRAQLEAEMPEATEAELDAALAELNAELKTLYQNIGYELVLDLYTLDEGTTLVGMDLTMDMTVEEDSQSLAMQATADYGRLTDENGVSHKASSLMAVDSVEAEMVFDLYRANSGKSEGMLGMLADGEEIVITYQAENTAADTREREIFLYTRSDATAILSPAASDRPLIGLRICTEPAPAETLAALESATPDNSVNVLKLSDTEMNNLLTTISNNGTQVLYAALAELPTSVMNLMMGEVE